MGQPDLPSGRPSLLSLEPRAAATNARRTFLAAAAASVSTLLLGAPSLFHPFGKDQAEYATIASAALEGRVVYRDVFNVKPPPTHLVHELALSLFGRSMVSIRLLDLLWQAVTVAVVAVAGALVFRRTGVGLVAGVFYALWYFGSNYWTTAQTDGFLTLPVGLSLLAFHRGRQSGSTLAFVASGAALGAAALFKYPIGILLPLLVAALWWEHRTGRRGAFAMLMGFLAPLACTALSLHAQGALTPFLSIQANYLPYYTAGHGQASYLEVVLVNALRLAWNDHGLQLSAAAFAGSLWLARRRRAVAAVLPILLWWLAAVAHLILQNKLWAYHALPLLAPQWLLLAGLLFAALDAAPGFLKACLAAAAIASFIWGYSARGYPAEHRLFLELVSGRSSLEEHYADPRFGRYGEGDHSMAANLEVARYVAARTAAGERIFVWGFEPAIYFLSDRPGASRFVYNFPLYGTFGWRSLRQEFLDELSRDDPVYFIVARNDPAPWITGRPEDSQGALREFPELERFLEARYQRETVIEDFTLYRRRP